MSRIGKKIIILPAGVEVRISGQEVVIKGPKGEEKIVLHPHIKATLQGSELSLSVANPEEKNDRALWGLFRALLAGQIEGVVKGFEKKLEMQGIGFKANLQGKKLVLEVGFSHLVEINLPDGVEVAIEKNIITIKGINKNIVGAFAAKIRAVRKPEPYKGKGIRYLGEIVRRKAGKAAKAAGAAVK